MHENLHARDGSLSARLAQVNNRQLWNPQASPSARYVTVSKPATQTTAHQSTQCHVSVYAPQNKQRLFPYTVLTDSSSVVWSGSMDDDEEGRTSSASFRKENI
jgi:hypothetical protein